MFANTPEQDAAIAGFLAGENMMIQAFAGCGKTSTQVLLAKAYSEKIDRRRKKLAIAFNRRAADELTDRLKDYPDWKVQTFNGLGMGVLYQNPKKWNRGNLDVKNNKVEKLCESMFETLHGQGRLLSTAVMNAMNTKALERALQSAVPSSYEMSMFLQASVNTCKIWGIRPGAFKIKDMLDTDVTEDETLAGRYSDVKHIELVPEARINAMVNALLDDNIEIAEKRGIIDYADQIYLSVLFCNNKGWQYPLILVDEVQDTSGLNIQQISRATTGQVCMVGDEFQTLYQFRGALEGNMAVLADEWKTKSYTLSKTFRCPVEVVDRAKAVIGRPEFTASNPLNKGEVLLPFLSRRRDAKVGWEMDDLLRAHNVRLGRDPKHRTVILCAMNAQCQTILALIAASPRFARGEFTVEQIGWSSNPLKLDNTFRVKAPLKFLAKVCQNKGVDLPDLIDGLNEPALGQANYNFVVSTVHRFKGLESDDVYIFNPESLLSKRNLYYVAQTRTKNRLAYLYPELLLTEWDKPTEELAAPVLGEEGAKGQGRAIATAATYWHQDKQNLWPHANFWAPDTIKSVQNDVLEAVKKSVAKNRMSLGTKLVLGAPATYQPILLAADMAKAVTKVPEKA